MASVCAPAAVCDILTEGEREEGRMRMYYGWRSSRVEITRWRERLRMDMERLGGRVRCHGLLSDDVDLGRLALALLWLHPHSRTIDSGGGCRTSPSMAPGVC